MSSKIEVNGIGNFSCRISDKTTVHWNKQAGTFTFDQNGQSITISEAELSSFARAETEAAYEHVTQKYGEEDKLDPADFCKHFKCDDCGHEQTVTPATVYYRDGEVVGIFGSGADFCDRCDGSLTEQIEDQ